MIMRWKALLAAFVSAAAINLVVVLALLNPIAAVDSAAGPLVHPAIGLLVYAGLSVCLFDWVARKMGNPYKAALAIAGAQFILVNVDFVLAGKRGLATAGASTVLLALTWVSVAWVYSLFTRKPTSSGDESVNGRGHS